MKPIPRPQKAYNKSYSLASLIFPLIASPKINGERVRIINSQARSSSGKLIPNRIVQELLGRQDLNGLDGEIIAGSDPTDPILRRKTRTITGSKICHEPFTFWVFDRWTRTGPFENVLKWSDSLSAWKIDAHIVCIPPYIQFVPQYEVHTLQALLTMESKALEKGYEGLILRSPAMPYKNGRSTWNEYLNGRGMLKLKRFKEETAIVLSTYPLTHNENTPTLTPQGYTERLGGQGGKTVDTSLLGGLRVRGTSGTHKDAIFNIGSAVSGVWSRATRQSLMSCTESLTNRSLRYRHFPDGNTDRPNQPHFICWEE